MLTSVISVIAIPTVDLSLVGCRTDDHSWFVVFPLSPLAAWTRIRLTYALSLSGGLSTIVASYLARARGSNEPELSITRTKDLEQFIRECQAFQMDFGHLTGNDHDETLQKFRSRFEELLGNANGYVFFLQKVWRSLTSEFATSFMVLSGNGSYLRQCDRFQKLKHLFFKLLCNDSSIGEYPSEGKVFVSFSVKILCPVITTVSMFGFDIV